MSCAFKDDNKLEANKNLLRQNSLINQIYGPLEGTYNGTLTSSSSSDNTAQDVSLRIKIMNEATTNPDGSPAIKRVPTAFLIRTSPVVDSYSLTVQSYTPETGELNLVAQNSNVLKSIDLIVTGERMTGKVYTTSGLIGTIDLSLFSRETDAPSDNNNEEIRNAYLKLYKKVEGRYVGEIVNPNPKIKNKPVAIELNIVNANTPFLRGYYSPLDAANAGLNLIMTVDYRPNFNPPRITLDGANTSPGSTYIINIEGIIKNDSVIIADITNVHQGYLGKLTVKKQQKPDR
jgi:hypothetical protein